MNCRIGKSFCGKCCYNTEMPLSEEDVRRIESLGYKREEFSIVVDGIRVLRNVGGRCYFLKNNRCSIYPYRPLGCRLYPLVMGEDGVGVDDECPKKNEVKVTEKAAAKLRELVEEIYGGRWRCSLRIGKDRGF